MPTREFNIGDLVIGVQQFDENDLIVGVVGEIVAIDPLNRYGVVYEENIGGHALNGKCDYGYVWWTSADCLEHYEMVEIETSDCPLSYDEVMI